jgi:hypothetical protein
LGWTIQMVGMVEVIPQHRQHQQQQTRSVIEEVKIFVTHDDDDYTDDLVLFQDCYNIYILYAVRFIYSTQWILTILIIARSFCP